MMVENEIPRRRPDAEASDDQHAAPDEGAALTIHVPISFRRHGGRKTLVGPDGASAASTNSPRAAECTAIAKALARAFRWRKLIESGVRATLDEVARAERINPSYASRILRLTLLAPDLVAGVLNKRLPRLSVDDLMKPFPVEWAEQSRAADAD